MQTNFIRTALPTIIRAGAIDDLGEGVWRLWLHSSDFVYGTYLLLDDDSSITQVTAREAQGDEIVCIKPAKINA